MNRPYFYLVLAALLLTCATSFAQLPPPPAPQPPDAPRVDARREVIVRWTLGDQAWNFDDIRPAYEPVRGYLEPRPNQGTLAVWKLRMVKDFEKEPPAFTKKCVARRLKSSCSTPIAP